METVLVSAEKSTMSPSSETPPVVKETKISEEVTLPTALEVPEEPKTSDAIEMDMDAPKKNQMQLKIISLLFSKLIYSCSISFSLF